MTAHGDRRDWWNVGEPGSYYDAVELTHRVLSPQVYT